MIAVIFEVWPHADHRNDYFDLAAALKPQLEKIDGFISVERFESLTEKGKFLSLSFWRDEEAVAQWRNLEQHRAAQAKGRGGIFRDYRLRIASVVRDYGMNNQVRGAEDLRAKHHHLTTMSPRPLEPGPMRRVSDAERWHGSRLALRLAGMTGGECATSP